MAKWTISLVAAALLALPGNSAAQSAVEYTAAVVTPGNNCLIPDSSGDLRVYKCTENGARYTIRNGVIRDAKGRCWDHGIPQGAPFTGRTAVHLVACHGGKSQVWYIFATDQKTRGLFQSAANNRACITLEGENRGPRAVVAQCDYEYPPPRQTIFVGERLTEKGRETAAKVLKPEVWRHLAARGSATLADGTQMVAAGAGNVIVAPGANMVAAGGGNALPSISTLIQPGGGGVLPSGAGRITAGGGTLVGNSGNTLVRLSGVGLKQ